MGTRYRQLREVLGRCGPDICYEGNYKSASWAGLCSTKAVSGASFGPERKAFLGGVDRHTQEWGWAGPINVEGGASGLSELPGWVAVRLDPQSPADGQHPGICG